MTHLLTHEDRLELLKVELHSLGMILDKYDEVVLRQRNWFITLWMACTGVSFSINSPVVTLLGVVLAIFYFIQEGVIRYQSWFKYVVRYRTIRDTLNREKQIEALSLYDLTNHYMPDHETSSLRLRKSFIKWDAVMVYFGMGLGSILLSVLMTRIDFNGFEFP